MDKSSDNCVVIVVVLAFLVLIYAGVALVGTWAWNFVAHGLLGAPEITFWHTVALLILLGIVGSAFKSSSKGS